MSDERKETFLARWSRLKRHPEAAESDRPAEAPVQPASEPPPAEATPEVAETAPPVELPPIESVTLETDITPFFRPEVTESLRRAALRKLFSDPHFNAMDGLDIYIDDYSKSEPIPPEMLAQLTHARQLLFDQSVESDAAREAAGSTEAPADTEPGAGAETGAAADATEEEREKMSRSSGA